MEKTYYLNPDYILRNDLKRVILTSPDGEGVTTFIHPLQAMILSFFDQPIEYSANIQRISENLNISESEIEDFLSKLINNSDKIWIGSGSTSCHFPENVLIENPENYSARGYHFRDFLMNGNDLDLISKRFYIPIEATLMINSICHTDCAYCYADRNYKFDSKIPFEKLCEIIDEAKKLNFRKLDTSGGEFFLYHNWEKLLEKLIASGFNSSIPTKIPLSSEQIKKIKSLGLKQIQISLDSTNPENLARILNVPKNYWYQLDNTFKELEKSGLNFRVNTIITSLNCNYHEIEDLIEYLLKYTYFDEISIGIVAYTLYKTNEQNENIIPRKTDADNIMNKLRERYKENEKIVLSGVQAKEDNYHLSEDAFFSKALCTGNLQLFYILADGKVTLCEELYWHPKFIIGDLTKQTIMEMWNSKEALELYHLKQTEYNEQSKCRSCDAFSDCHLYGNKCWREILKVYGKDNWHFPDPRCSLSPEPIHNIYAS